MDKIFNTYNKPRSNQLKQKKCLLKLNNQNSTNLLNCQSTTYAFENEADCCPPEVLSLESDYSSNNGCVDSSDQHEVLNEETLTENKDISFTFNQEISIRKNDDVKKDIDYDDHRKTKLIKKQYHENFQNEQLSKNNLFCPTMQDDKEKFIPVTSRHSAIDIYNDVRHSPFKDKAISQKKITFEDSNLKYAELTHQQLKSTLSDIQEQSLNCNDECMFSRPNLCYETMQGKKFAFEDGNTTQIQSTNKLFEKQDQLHSNYIIASSFPSDDYKSSCQLMPNAKKFDAILQIKDDMLQEKESSIMKLKLQVASLQHQLQESETALHQTGMLPLKKFFSPPSFSSSDFGRHFHERKVFELEQLLGKTESKLLDMTTKYKIEKKEMLENMKFLKSTARDKEQAYLDMKKKYKTVLERLEKYRHRVQSLEQYLGDLPTIEENDQIKAEANMLGQERKTLIVEIAECQAKLEENKKVIQSYEQKVMSLQDDLDIKLKLIDDLHKKLAKSKKSKEALGRNERDELEDLRLEFSQLQKSKENISVMLTACEKRLKVQQEKHEKELAALTAKVQEAKELAENSRRDVFMKQQASKKINSAVKTLSLQNQHLLDENLNLHEKVKNQGKLNISLTEVSRTYAKIQQEANAAVKELRGVTQVLAQTADGADPDISALLGVGSDSSVCEEELIDPSGENSNPVESGLTIEEAKKRLIELRLLRKNVDQLRTSLSNRYADAIGDNCVTQ